MSETFVSVDEVLTSHGSSLNLRLLTDQGTLARIIKSPRLQKPSLAFAGFTDHLDDYCMQVIGKTELAYLSTLPGHRQQEVIDAFFDLKVAAVVLTHDTPPPPIVMAAARRTHTALLITSLSSEDFMVSMMIELARRLAPVSRHHGVFMDIYGQGVLLRAASGLGKSEVALELITRGHRLIADDSVEFRREAANTLVGRCPEISQDMLEVRGLGLVNVRHLFGSSAITRSKKATLVVRFIKSEDFSHDRISPPWKQESIHGVCIPLAELPVLPGRSLAVLVETVTRIHIHQQQGDGDDHSVFIERINALACPSPTNVTPVSHQAVSRKAHFCRHSDATAKK